MHTGYTMVNIYKFTGKILEFITGYTPMGEIEDCPNIDDCKKYHKNKLNYHSTRNRCIKKNPRNIGYRVIVNKTSPKNVERQQEIIEREITPWNRYSSKKSDVINIGKEVTNIERENTSTIWDCINNRPTYLKNNNAKEYNNRTRDYSHEKRSPEKHVNNIKKEIVVSKKRVSSPKKQINTQINLKKRGSSPKKHINNIINPKKKVSSPKKNINIPINLKNRGSSPKKQINNIINPKNRGSSPKKQINTIINPKKRGSSPKKQTNTILYNREREYSPNKQTTTINPNKRTYSPKKIMNNQKNPRKRASSTNKQNTTHKILRIRAISPRKQTNTTNYRERKSSPTNKSNKQINEKKRAKSLNKYFNKKKMISSRKIVSSPQQVNTSSTNKTKSRIRKSSTNKQTNKIINLRKIATPKKRSRSRINQKIQTRNKDNSPKSRIGIQKKLESNITSNSPENVNKIVKRSRRCLNKFPHPCGNITQSKINEKKKMKNNGKKICRKPFVNLSTLTTKTTEIPKNVKKIISSPETLQKSKYKVNNGVTFKKASNGPTVDKVDKATEITAEDVGELKPSFSYMEDVIPNPMVLYNSMMSYLEVDDTEQMAARMEDDSVKKRRIIDEVMKVERRMSNSRVVRQNFRRDAENTVNSRQTFDVYAESPADFNEKKAKKKRTRKLVTEKLEHLRIANGHEDEYTTSMSDEQDDIVGSIRLTKSL